MHVLTACMVQGAFEGIRAIRRCNTGYQTLRLTIQDDFFFMWKEFVYHGLEDLIELRVADMEENGECVLWLFLRILKI